MFLFKVEETLNHNKGLAKFANLLGYCLATIDKIINQWRSIHLQKGEETTNTFAFWAKMKKYTDLAGINP